MHHEMEWAPRSGGADTSACPQKWGSFFTNPLRCQEEAPQIWVALSSAMSSVHVKLSFRSHTLEWIWFSYCGDMCDSGRHKANNTTPIPDFTFLIFVCHTRLEIKGFMCVFGHVLFDPGADFGHSTLLHFNIHYTLIVKGNKHCTQVYCKIK